MPEEQNPDHLHFHDANGTPVVIKLDGSIGIADRAILTLITKDEIHGKKEESFLFPMMLIDKEWLIRALEGRLIRGFTLEREDAPAPEGT